MAECLRMPALLCGQVIKSIETQMQKDQPPAAPRGSGDGFSFDGMGGRTRHPLTPDDSNGAGAGAVPASTDPLRAEANVRRAPPAPPPEDSAHFLTSFFGTGKPGRPDAAPPSAAPSFAAAAPSFAAATPRADEVDRPAHEAQRERFELESIRRRGTPAWDPACPGSRTTRE